MTESSMIRRDNPFFIRYGTLVDRCFADDLGVGSPLALFPATVQGGKDEGIGRKHLADYANPDEVAMAQRLVDKWRTALGEEARIHDKGGGLRVSQEITQHLADFRAGLQSGKEAMLEENPFYELTMLFYRINLAAFENAFVATCAAAGDNPPKPIKVSRSYQHIWGSDSSVTSLRQKLQETLAKVGSLGKLAVGMVLFAGSTLTTAKGVIDLVQLPGFVAVFGGGFLGAANESARTLFSVIVGLVLSSVILDFKSRLFLGTAEVGKVGRGYLHAFRCYPRWVVIATFLTMLSIWTNYDGIVLLMSKTEDLAFQWQKIEAQVKSALGDVAHPNVEQPGTLFDLHAALLKKAGEAVKKFQQIPDDEKSGAASSGIASVGPRYWAKHFIVNGGYIRGSSDVAAVYKRSDLVNQIDGMLVRSGLDLKASLEDKIRKIIFDYEEEFKRSEAAVQKGMTTLSERMTFKEYSLVELDAMFSLESYHVNAWVQDVVDHLEENKNAFSRAAQAINQLAEVHIALLRSVDKIGVLANNDYTIDVKMGIPQVEAIDQLRKGEIPMAKRRDLGELKELLLERYGAFMGSLFLFVILFFAIFMDLSDPILYSAMIARWGGRDRHFLNENLARFRNWEDSYVQTLRKFLVQPEVLSLLPKLPSPKIQNFHHLYNLFLEDVEPRVKDAVNRGWWERLRFWFFGLFTETRIGYVEGYNARRTAVMRCLRDPENYAPRLLNRVFPGLLDHVRVGTDHFDTLFEKIYRDMRRDAVLFEQALLAYAPDSQERVEAADSALVPGQPASRSLWRMVLRSGFRGSGGWRVLQAVYNWLRLLFWQSLAIAEPAFPLTRLSRLRDLAMSNYKSRDHINYLADFIPSLRHFLRERLFVIKRELLQPLAEALARIPNGAMIEHSLGVKALRVEYFRIERGLMELLGLSQFQGLQISEQMVRTIIEQSEIDELIAIYLRRDATETVLEQRVGHLETRLARAYKLIKDLVEGQDVLIFTLTKIRREYLSPINVTLSQLQTRAKVEEFLGLHKMKEDLAIIERCLLELWDTSDPSLMLEGEECAGHSDMGAVVDLIRRNTVAGTAFDMIGYVKQLEVGIAGARKKLDGAIYQLTLVDKIMGNINSLLDHSLQLVEDVLAKDAALQDFPPFDQDVDQKKIDFLTDNRLFFRTVPLQVDSLRARINTLGKGAGEELGFSVELARDLEKQAIMLRYFLKNTLDYLEGKRDSIGLTAALAELRPRTKSIAPSMVAIQATGAEPVVAAEPVIAEEPKVTAELEPEVVVEVAATADPKDAADAGVVAELAAVAATVAASEETSSPLSEVVASVSPVVVAEPAVSGSLVDGIHKSCNRAKQILLDLSLLEWDLLRKTIPPRDLLQKIHAQQPAVDQANMDVEGVLIALERLVRTGGKHLESDSRQVAALHGLRVQVAGILERLGLIFDRVSLPGFGDRRSARQPLTELDEQRRLLDRVHRAEVASRRGVERTVLRSQLEIRLADGRKLFATTRDISSRALCLESALLLDGLVVGMEVHFRLLGDEQPQLFPGKLLRIRGSMLVITLLSGYEAQFINLVRAEILRERAAGGAGVLNPKLPDLPVD